VMRRQATPAMSNSGGRRVRGRTRRLRPTPLQGTPSSWPRSTTDHMQASCARTAMRRSATTA
jgi:hypothetical protein